MDSIQKTITELSEHFTARMTEFQQSLQTSIPAASPSSNINAQFMAFRSFMLSSLESLQLQVQLLSQQQDNMEMRSRRKILLVHGFPEKKGERICEVVTKVLSEKLVMPDLNVACVSRCHRLGSPRSDKPRAILIKFNDLSTRNKLWFKKTALKDSGITLSEFLTKQRHDIFMAARQRLGVSNCWTNEGRIVVIMPNGTRRQIVNMLELNALAPGSDVSAQRPIVPTISSPHVPESEDTARRRKAPTASTSSAIPSPRVIKPLRPKKTVRRW